MSAADTVTRIAAVLTAHDLLTDGMCRCGWGPVDIAIGALLRDGTTVADPGVDAELFHPEHVAAQLVNAGVVLTAGGAR